MPTTLYLIRHGATAQNSHRPVILQGNAINGPLNEIGHRQAREVADFLASRPVAAVYSSPMIRARQTAESVAAPHRLAITPLDRLHEVDVGDWEGKTWTQIMEDDPEYYSHFMSDPAVPYRGGESYVQVLERVRPVFESLLQRHAGETFAVVAHNVVNRVYLASLLGDSLLSSRRIRQMNCCLNLIHAEAGRPELIAMNSVFHLSEW